MRYDNLLVTQLFIGNSRKLFIVFLFIFSVTTVVTTEPNIVQLSAKDC